LGEACGQTDRNDLSITHSFLAVLKKYTQYTLPYLHLFEAMTNSHYHYKCLLCAGRVRVTVKIIDNINLK